ncbi:MAG TPA: hypothetical protein VMF91_07760 [Bryobacteraceae bacterium]|nr:hypothetical protein [Bryobacteraceae bacterium]
MNILQLSWADPEICSGEVESVIQFLRRSLGSQGDAQAHRVLPTTNPAFLGLQNQSRVLPVLGISRNRGVD